MKKRKRDMDFFYLSETMQFNKHLRHGKYPYEKTQERAEKKAVRMEARQEMESEISDFYFTED